MAIIAIDWDSSGLTGVESSGTGGDIKVLKTFSVEWPEHIDPKDDPQGAAQHLKNALATAGVKSNQVVVSLPRDETVMRPLQLPAVDDSELAGMVRLQAATKSTVPLEQLRLDYIPLPPRDGVDGREVLMSTVGKPSFDLIRRVLKIADLELVAAGISSIATAEFIARQNKKSGTHGNDLIVMNVGDRLELTTLKMGRVVSSHAAHLSAASPEQLQKQTVAEINRLRMSLSSDLDINGFANAWLIGSESATAGLKEALTARLDDCNVFSIDPLTAVRSSVKPDATDIAPQRYPALASSIGVLQGQKSPTIDNVNFVSPRKPVVKKDMRGLYIGLAAGAALLLAVVGWVMVANRVADLDAQIAAKNDSAAEQTAAFKEGKETLAAARVIGDWNNHKVNWLDEMINVNEILPDTGDLYVTKFTFDKKNGAYAGRIQALGYARTRRTIQDLKTDARNALYAVVPTPIEPASRSGYNHELNLDMTVLTEAEKQIAMEARAPKKKK